METMQETILDISMLDNDFYLSILNMILETKKSREDGNELQKI